MPSLWEYKGEKNGKKPTVLKTFCATLAVNNHFGDPIQFAYKYKGADHRIKRQVRSMTLNGSGIRDIQRVLGISICGILFILRYWSINLDEPVIEGHFKRV